MCGENKHQHLLHLMRAVSADLLQAIRLTAGGLDPNRPSAILCLFRFIVSRDASTSETGVRSMAAPLLLTANCDVNAALTVAAAVASVSSSE
jgi:hypothetical protein